MNATNHAIVQEQKITKIFGFLKRLVQIFIVMILASLYEVNKQGFYALTDNLIKIIVRFILIIFGLVDTAPPDEPVGRGAQAVLRSHQAQRDQRPLL